MGPFYTDIASRHRNNQKNRYNDVCEGYILTFRLLVGTWKITILNEQ